MSARPGYGKLLILAVTASFLAGCGYKLGPVKPAKFQHIKTLAVPVFFNATQEPRISALLTNALLKRLQMDGTYQIASTKDADAILKGRIVEIDRTQARAVRNDTIRSRELRISVEVEYEVVDSATGAVITGGTAKGDSNIILGRNFQQSERQSISDASDRLAMEIIGRICDGW